MGVRLYDEAILNKITKWVKDPNMKILRPDEVTELFRIRADINKDKPLTLPLIALSRDKEIEILSTEKQSKTFSGFTIQKNEKCSMLLNAIPIKIGYQLDIYTRFIDEADEYIRNFVFNLINLPNVEITIPYNDVNLKHKSTIQLDSSVVDNSDIPQRLFTDQFTRFTIRFTVDDAYLFSVPVKENTILEIDSLDILDKETKEIVDTEELDFLVKKSSK